MVNGIVATPFGGVNPTLANMFYNLHRLAYTLAGKGTLGAWVQGATEGLWAGMEVLSAIVRPTPLPRLRHPFHSFFFLGPLHTHRHSRRYRSS